jgi:hypothetical protein
MKTFREHIKEEVKIGALSSGGIDIERDAVRDEINGILSAIAVRPCVTPYASLNKIRKALAYFSIFLPKKVYLEGRHGIEVWEVCQFGDKMGFTDQGEWIRNVPCKYYLFFHYHRIGSMYYLEAKIVDDKELETKISTTEKMFAEEMDAAMRQDLAKAKAPKEDPHTALGDCDCSQGDSPSTKKAVKVSMKKIDEGRGMPASVIKHKQKLAGMTPEEKKKHFVGKSEEELKSMARRHGYGKDSDEYSKHVTKMEEDKDPCWKGYEMVGMKKKGGRKVPNCVPVKEEEQIDEKAPPGAKFERMVKHIKKGYSKDGLTAYCLRYSMESKEA